MSKLEKAKLSEVKADTDEEVPNTSVEVQFNPTTLKLQLTNQVSDGQTRGNQARQYTGTGSTTLSLDLIFDTADEGTTDSPRSVREKTNAIERFVLPHGKPGEKQAPPRVRFQWAQLILIGVIDSISIDLDHFAANGTPLRAKVSVTIKEQNSLFQLLKAGPGANGGGGAPAAGGLGLGLGISASAGLSLGGGVIGFGAVGSVGVDLGFSAQAGLAIGGESAAGFAARVGVDVEAWRGLSLGDANPLSLSAGMEVGFSANLSAGIGLGVSSGITAGVSASFEASFGLEVGGGISGGISGGFSAGFSAGFSGGFSGGVGGGAAIGGSVSAVGGAAGGTAAGFALAAAGGVSAAVATVQSARNQRQQVNEKRAFSLPAATPAPPRPGLPEQPRPPLAVTGLPPAWRQTPAAPPPPRVDPREASFGSGLPLRTTFGPGAETRAGVVQGAVPLRDARPETGEPPTTTDRTIPGWVALPERARGAPGMLKRKSCGCTGPCRCGG